MNRDPQQRRVFKGLALTASALGALLLPADTTPQHIGSRGLIEIGEYDELLEGYSNDQAQFFGAGLSMACDPEVVSEKVSDAVELEILMAWPETSPKYEALQEGFAQGDAANQEGRC